MNRFVPLFAVSLLLAGCASVVNGATQEITINTPGTGGALCFLDRPGYDQRIWAPETFRITKSKDDINVRCLAPGNREKTVIAKSKVESSYFLNVANAIVPGSVVDYSTGAMFVYPSVVTVDFTDMAPSEQPLPDYQELLQAHPELANLEEFRPGVPALQSDRGVAVRELQPRTTEPGLGDDAYIMGAAPSEPAPAAKQSSSSSSSSSDKSSAAATAPPPSSTGSAPIPLLIQPK